ncbi:MAG: hypothetical protein EOP46_03305 [Sphingobacteriaceae bacterium]|nr:MAG: hypothetical protein EOP46_03305 [Sphingobacteriaceae bacterium]
MKRITNFLVILFILLGFSAFAQNAAPNFVVYYAKGKTTVSNAGKISTVKKADKLYGADKITVAKGAEVTLLCAKYSLIKLTAGTYTVKSLLPKCKPGSDSFTANYFHYVWEQMSHHHGKAEDHPEEYMKTAGAVARSKQPVKLALAVDTIYYTATAALNINWQPAQTSLTFKLYADSLAQVAEKIAPITKSVRLDSLAAGLETGSYLWQLCNTDGKECGSLSYLEVLTKVEYDSKVSAILAKVVITDLAETAFMSGFILEQNHFIAEAAKYYKQAALLKPNNIIYTNTYKRFL